MDLLHKRPDGTFVAAINGHPYHVIPGDEPLWSAAVERARILGRKLKLEPAPAAVEAPPRTTLSKADLWRRLTDDEADMLDAALSMAPTRLRRIFEAAQYLDTTDADYPALREGVIAALGEERADVVLTPES